MKVIKGFYPSRTFIYPDTMESNEQVEKHIGRLKSWASSQCELYITQRRDIHMNFLKEFERTAFKGRYKSNITVFHERSVKALNKIIHDKGKSKR